MKATELLTMLRSFIPARLSALITGKPGIGKTDIVEQATKECGADLIVSHPVTQDPTDFKGLPAKVSDTMAAFLPFGDLAQAMSADKPTVWFFDDLGQASPSTQAAAMQLFLKREINGKRISDEIVFMAATNRRADKAGVSGILEPVKSRFASIVELEADLQSWCEWAIRPNSIISPELIAFLRLRADLLSAFVPTADMTNSPSPRTWSHLAKIEALNLPREINHIAMAGSVGEGAATEYLAFKSLIASMVSVDAILADPAGSALPKNPSECYAVSTGLAARANDKTIQRIGTYANRLATANKGEFAALIVRDSIRRCPAIANTKEYVKLMCGPLGALISGQSAS